MPKDTPAEHKAKMTNLRFWEKLETTDPKFVKPITGKSYKGNSPHPTWLVKRLTEVFGPVGHGFGWEVIFEQYVEGQPHRIMVSADTAQIVRELMHELRILFWTRDPETGERGNWESYGSTKALYLSKQGQWIHDEDAAKKSLTDAVTKAASQTGSAADIFLGRWDDNKYVAEVAKEFSGSSAEAPVTPAAPAQRPGTQSRVQEIDF